jgi:hypothetical protein
MKGIFKNKTLTFSAIGLLVVLGLLFMGANKEFYTINRLQVKSIEPLPGLGSANTIPASGLKGWETGAKFFKQGATLGQSIQWINVGDKTGCLFVPTGPVMGYGFARGGYRAATTGSATQTFSVDDIRASDFSLAEYAVSDDTDQLLAQVTADGKITLTLGADPLAAHGLNWVVMRNKCVPDYDIFAAGTRTTVGGSTAEAITVTGAQAGDMAFVTYSATDDTDTIAKAVVTANTLTVTMSADPGATHGHHYMILRPRGAFKPSHYVAYAGTATTVGGAAAEAFTITGALATDIPIVKYKTTDDTDTILKSVMTANTLTVTFSANPIAAHSIAYVILRAY